MRKVIHVLVGFALAASVACAATVSLLPGIVSFDFLPPGVKFDMKAQTGIPLYLPNENEYPIVYKMSLEGGKSPEHLLPGYTNFPDFSWCRIEPESIVVQPNDTGEVNLYIDLPNDPKLCNRHWEIGVVAKSASGMTLSAGAVNFGIFPSVRGSVLISTKPDNTYNPTDVSAVVAPSAKFVPLSAALSGTDYVFTLFNNDTVAHEYTVESYKFPEEGPGGIRLSIQATGEHLSGKTDWIKPVDAPKVTVPAKQSKVVKINIKIPDTPEVRAADGVDCVMQFLPEGNRANSAICRFIVLNTAK